VMASNLAIMHMYVRIFMSYKSVSDSIEFIGHTNTAFLVQLISIHNQQLVKPQVTFHEQFLCGVHWS